LNKTNIYKVKKDAKINYLYYEVEVEYLHDQTQLIIGFTGEN